MLFMSRKDMWRRTLPMPDFNGFVEVGRCCSSAAGFCGRGRGRGRGCVMAPALKLRSDRKDSRSEANFIRALSKSKSELPLETWDVRLGEDAPRMVMLLRLLLDSLGSVMRVSPDTLERR